jgi:CheY-like chemotaxis protein
MAIVADSARRKGLATEVTVTGEADAPLMIDDLRVRQILLNLLSNAIKFTPQGQVSLTLSTGPVEAGQRRLRFEITDTGVGVAPDKLDRLFKRFSQADGSVSRAYGGTGLGLAISKGLAEQMGGRIGVESRAGEGSCFWFEITAAQAVADDEAAEGGETDDLADLQGAHVLLVDDHPMNRELGHTILGLLGCQVDLADGGAAAIEAARNGRYDAVLMDLHMPHMDGFEAARRIRALEGEAGRVPIIALSADVMPATLGRCLEAGMVDAAPKPIQIQVLYEVLTRWVGRTADGQARAA